MLSVDLLCLIRMSPVATWPPNLPISDVAAAPPKRGVVAKLEAAK